MCNPVLELQLWIHQQLERRYELLQGGAVEPGSQLIDEVSRAGMIRVHRTARISVHEPELDMFQARRTWWEVQCQRGPQS